MAVVASVQLADVGTLTALRLLRSAPRPGSIDGLRHANVAAATPLRAAGAPRPSLRRLALLAFWDSDDDLDRFLAQHPLAATLAGGWHARLEPLRAFGTWPGLPDDLSRERATDYTGPALVLTLGRVRLTQVLRFLRTSLAAEAAARTAGGMVWGTALARPPFVATCSLWESTRDLATYAYGARQAAHPDAIDADAAKPFHHQSAFIRFQPYTVVGSLTGKNPLPEHGLA